MKALKKIAVIAALFLFLISITSCVVLAPTQHHDNGKHKGWNKHQKNSNYLILKQGKGEKNQGYNKHKAKGKKKKH